MTGDSTIEVRDDAESHRYEIFVDGDRAGFSAYRDEGNTRVFTHTVVDDDYAGAGIGGRLVAAALDDVREHGRTVVARCPFVRSYLERHPNYADLISD